MHRHDDAPSCTPLVVLNAAISVVTVFAAVLAIAHAQPQLRQDHTRIDRLERFASEQSKEIADLRGRVLRLERPDEPVYPPRNPGRIGGKPVIPWIEPWSGSRPSLGTEIGSPTTTQ